jgi:hypothetical protein
MDHGPIRTKRGFLKTTRASPRTPSIKCKQYGNTNAHIAAIELLEITIKALKTTQSHDEAIDPISQIATLFAIPITTTESTINTPWYIQVL